MRGRGSWVLVGAVIIAVGGCSKTDERQASSRQQPAGRPAAVGTGGAGADVKSDGEFVHDVATKNMAEIELSRMALEKASAPEIKAFAQKILDDHTAAGDKLRSTLAEQSIQWPAQLDEKHREPAEELAKKAGADFDREYLEAVVESQQNLAAKLESRLDVQSLADWKTAAAARTQTKAMPEPNAAMGDVAVRPSKSDNGTTTKINQWAAEMYPVAQKHIDTARTLENTIKERRND